MRSFLFFFLLMFSLISCTFQRDTPHGTASKNPSLWSQIENTTWIEDNGWAGITYVFFTDDHGEKRCIRQTQGSGVAALNLFSLSLTFSGDTVSLAEPNTPSSNNYTLSGEKELVSKDRTLLLFERKPLVYDRTKVVDINLVKSGKFVFEHGQFLIKK